VRREEQRVVAHALQRLFAEHVLQHSRAWGHDVGQTGRADVVVV
jgi:hypothetical protein